MARGKSSRNKEVRYPYMADEDLISLIEARDPAALTIVYDRHSRPAYSLALRTVRQRQAAEEVVQESFLKVWRFARTYRAQRGSARTWILSIVHNQSIDRLRREVSRQNAHERLEASLEALTANAVQPSEAFEQTQNSLWRGRLREALDMLPEEQRRIIQLAYFQDHTHTEIAQMLGLPLGTVKGRIRLGLKKLDDHFGVSGRVERSA